MIIRSKSYELEIRESRVHKASHQYWKSNKHSKLNRSFYADSHRESGPSVIEYGINQYFYNKGELQNCDTPYEFWLEPNFGRN